MSATDAALPRWDMTPIFPSLESAEFSAAFASALSDLDALAALFDKHSVRKRETDAVDAEFAAAYDAVTAPVNALLDKMRTLGAYIGCFTTTNANDETAKSAESKLDMDYVRLSQLMTRYVAWVGFSDVESLKQKSELAASNAYALAKAQYQARHQMSEAEESLAAELSASGISGWAKLHGNITALLTAKVEIGGETKTLPMSEIRSLANNADRAIRQAAYDAEIKAWETVTVPLAAALNGVKGYQQTVRKRRGYANDVEPTLLSNGIDRPTLDAMQAACVESFPDFRRYMALKARALGVEKLAWHDLLAPLGETSRRYAWPEAEDVIRTNFAAFSDRMADFAETTFREKWIDAGPRYGKEGGAYCTGTRPGESRVFMNFDGSANGVSTLAHELGHAYHNLNLKDRSPMQRSTPMTLAETASLFCETLVSAAEMRRAAPQEKLTLLDRDLQGDCQIVIDIHSRFLFEQSVFDLRSQRDLNASEFSEKMLAAQKATYGENMDSLHPYMWAVKGHYYGPLFYNYPYTFGALFTISLYNVYLQDQNSFRARYDDFLSSTGLADAPTLAKNFGLDITDLAFWRGGLNVIRAKIDDFAQLVK